MDIVYPIYLPTDVETGVMDDIIPATAQYAYPAYFPGYVGVEGIHNANDGGVPEVGSLSVASAGVPIDYNVGAEFGAVNTNPYSIYGPVSPNSVENFELMGTVLENPRQMEYSSGEVSHLDYLAEIAGQVSQQMAPEVSAEQALQALLFGGYN